MHSAERPRERDRDAQEMRYVQWLAKQSIKRRTAGIFKHQRHAVVVVRQRDWSCRPVSVKLGLERIFVFEVARRNRVKFLPWQQAGSAPSRCRSPDRERCLPLSAVRIRSPRDRSREPPARRTASLCTLIRLRLLPASQFQKQALKKATCHDRRDHNGQTMTSALQMASSVTGSRSLPRCPAPVLDQECSDRSGMGASPFKNYLIS